MSAEGSLPFGGPVEAAAPFASPSWLCGASVFSLFSSISPDPLEEQSALPPASSLPLACHLSRDLAAAWLPALLCDPWSNFQRHFFLTGPHLVLDPVSLALTVFCYHIEPHSRIIPLTTISGQLPATGSHSIIAPNWLFKPWCGNYQLCPRSLLAS